MGKREKTIDKINDSKSRAQQTRRRFRIDI